MKIKLVITVLLLYISQLTIAQIDFDVNVLNQEVYDSTLDNNIMLGKFDVEGMKNAKVFKRSMKVGKKYSPNTEIFVPGGVTVNNLQITIVMGSWCPDSQLEVPKMIMILEAIDYPMDMLEIIAVNRWKKVPEMNISSLNIKYVPTFIFYKEGVEVGRIVETPKQSLEFDMVNILNKIQ